MEDRSLHHIKRDSGADKNLIRIPIFWFFGDIYDKMIPVNTDTHFKTALSIL